MKKDIINGFEHLIFEESEIEQARATEAAGHSRVRISTPCDECGNPVHCTIWDIDHRGEDYPIRHTESYHEWLDRV